MIFLPVYTAPLVIVSGAYYSFVGFKDKIVNKVIFASAIVQIITLPSLVIGIPLGLIPCLSGPPDGFCMLAGIPFIFLNFLLWLAGFIVLIVRIIKENKSK